MSFLTNLGINSDHLRFRDHTAEELAFYSKGTCDIEYNFIPRLVGVSCGELRTEPIMI